MAVVGALGAAQYQQQGAIGKYNQAVQNINGELLYVNKKRDAYGFGIGLNPDFQPVYTVRMYWKIGK